MGVRVNGVEQGGGVVTNEIDSVQGTVTFEVNETNVYAYSPTDDSDLELFMGASPGQIGMFAGKVGSTVTLGHDAGAGSSELTLNSGVAELKAAAAKQLRLLSTGTGGALLEATNGEVVVKAGGSNSRIFFDGTVVLVEGPEVKLGTTKIAFFTGSPSVKAAITGSRALPEQAFKNLLIELAAKGLITDSTTV